VLGPAVPPAFIGLREVFKAIMLALRLMCVHTLSILETSVHSLALTMYWLPSLPVITVPKSCSAADTVGEGLGPRGLILWSWDKRDTASLLWSKDKRDTVSRKTTHPSYSSPGRTTYLLFFIPLGLCGLLDSFGKVLGCLGHVGESEEVGRNRANWLLFSIE
jgi:hypothetical protein